MFIDRGTLLDLEIFATSGPSRLTILSLVDRTRTEAGRQNLRRRLSAPAETAGDIEVLQDAHQTVTPDLAAFRTCLDRADPDGALRYLNSRWELPTVRNWLTRTLAGVLFGLRYSAYLQDIAKGQPRVLALLRGADEIRRRLSSVSNPLLRGLAENLGAQLNTPECTGLLRIGERRSGSSRLAFDQHARGKAKERLLLLADLLGQFESLWSIAAATVEHGWTYPTAGNRLRIEGLTHPFLGKQAVANTFELGAEVRVCFLTGPNMAGKSTFLKAVAVAMILAQVGSGVPAVSMEFAPVRTVFSSVQIVDNIGAGESFYLAEVRRIHGLAVAVREYGSAVAVIDEPFRGTNAHDAAEATLAVITRLAAHKSVVTLVASHLGEVGSLIANDARIRSLHFAADVSAEPPRFDFKLRDGVSNQRLGMILLRQEHVLELLELSVPSPGAA